MKRKIVAVLIFIACTTHAFADEHSNVDIAANQNNLITTKSYKECLAVTMWLVAGGAVNKLRDDNSIDGAVKIPKGWTLVGVGISVSGPSNNEPVMFICH